MKKMTKMLDLMSEAIALTYKEFESYVKTGETGIEAAYTVRDNLIYRGFTPIQAKQLVCMAIGAGVNDKHYFSESFDTYVKAKVGDMQ